MIEQEELWNELSLCSAMRTAGPAQEVWLPGLRRSGYECAPRRWVRGSESETRTDNSDLCG
jgi:hypothetical protein